MLHHCFDQSCHPPWTLGASTRLYRFPAAPTTSSTEVREATEPSGAILNCKSPSIFRFTKLRKAPSRMNLMEQNEWDVSPINASLYAGQPVGDECATAVGVHVNLLATETPASETLNTLISSSPCNGLFSLGPNSNNNHVTLPASIHTTHSRLWAQLPLKEVMQTIGDIHADFSTQSKPSTARQLKRRQYKQIMRRCLWAETRTPNHTLRPPPP
jgi:hypothetical protein